MHFSVILNYAKHYVWHATLEISNTIIIFELLSFRAFDLEENNSFRLLILKYQVALIKMLLNIANYIDMNLSSKWIFKYI